MKLTLTQSGATYQAQFNNDGSPFQVEVLGEGDTLLTIYSKTDSDFVEIYSQVGKDMNFTLWNCGISQVVKVVIGNNADIWVNGEGVSA